MFDAVFSFVRVLASSLSDAGSSAPLYNVGGVGDFEDAEDEVGHAEPVFNGLGLVGRPLDPESDDTEYLEALAARVSDGLVPFAYRDLRIHRALNPGPTPSVPAKGQLLFAGYGGAFLGHTHDTATGTDTEVWYCPFAFVGGVATRAHSVILDPAEDAVSVIHADGGALLLTPTATILKSPDGSCFLELRDGKMILNAAQVVVRGGMLIGDESLGVPFPVVYMLAGVPTPSTLMTVSA